MALGLSRAGWLGRLAAWLGFTLPSAIALILFAYGVRRWTDLAAAGALHGLEGGGGGRGRAGRLGHGPVAVPGPRRAPASRSLAALARAGRADGRRAGHGDRRWPAWPAGWCCSCRTPGRSPMPPTVYPGRRGAVAAGAVRPAPARAARCCRGCWAIGSSRRSKAFYRAGSLVFGGGHVVLPLLQAAVVPSGMVGNDGVPGGLWRRASGAGAPVHLRRLSSARPASARSAAGPAGCCCLPSIFLPAFLLVVGALPFWDALRRRAGDPVGAGRRECRRWSACCSRRCTTRSGPAPSRPAPTSRSALAAFGLLVYARVSPVIVVLLCAAAGFAFLA